MQKLVKEPTFEGVPLSTWENIGVPDYATRMNLLNEFVRQHLLGCVVEAEKRFINGETPFIVADKIPEKPAARLLSLAKSYREVELTLLRERHQLSLVTYKVGNVYVPFEVADLIKIKFIRGRIEKFIKLLQVTAEKLIRLDKRHMDRLYKYQEVEA